MPTQILVGSNWLAAMPRVWMPNPARMITLAAGGNAGNAYGVVITPNQNLAWPGKDAADELDYSLDATAWLAPGEVLFAMSVAFTDPALVQLSQVFTATKAIAWFTGGTANSLALVNVTLTTTAGRIGRFAISLPITPLNEVEMSGTGTATGGVTPAQLAAAVGAETSRAVGAETSLGVSIVTAQSALQAAISTETQRATGVENSLAETLAVLASSGGTGTGGGVTPAQLLAEQTRAETAEGTLTASLTTLGTTVAGHTAELSTLSAGLAGETERATSAEGTLAAQIAALGSGTGTTTGGVTEAQLTAVETSLGGSITAETARAVAAENGLSSSISTLSNSLTTMVTTAALDAAIAPLATTASLAGETERATSAEGSISAVANAALPSANFTGAQIIGKLNSSPQDFSTQEVTPTGGTQATFAAALAGINATLLSHGGSLTSLSGSLTSETQRAETAEGNATAIANAALPAASLTSGLIYTKLSAAPIDLSTQLVTPTGANQANFATWLSSITTSLTGLGTSVTANSTAISGETERATSAEGTISAVANAALPSASFTALQIIGKLNSSPQDFSTQQVTPAGGTQTTFGAGLAAISTVANAALPSANFTGAQIITKLNAAPQDFSSQEVTPTGGTQTTFAASLASISTVANAALPSASFTAGQIIGKLNSTPQDFSTQEVTPTGGTQSTFGTLLAAISTTATAALPAVNFTGAQIISKLNSSPQDFSSQEVTPTGGTQSTFGTTLAGINATLLSYGGSLTSISTSLTTTATQATKAQTVTFSATVPGAPGAGVQLWTIPIAQAITVPVNFAGSLAVASAAATAAAAFTLAYIRSGATTTLGTVTYPAGSATGTFSALASAFNFLVGDILTLTTPSPADLTLANPGITLLATRT